MPYLEHVGSSGVSCARRRRYTPEWVGYLSPAMEYVSDHNSSLGSSAILGPPACLNALYAAGRHDESLALTVKSEYRYRSSHCRVWRAKASAAAGKHAEAAQYAESRRGQ
jgi:hypothetical protein